MGTWHERSRALAILSREVGYIRKPHGDRLRVALAFPNSYYVGMSNLGFQAAYRRFNDLDEVACERVFLPPWQELRDGTFRGPLLTLESQTPAGDADILAFSVSFEWDYPNLLTLLRLAGLPARSAARTGRHPLVVLGGAVTFLNPEPLAPFVDVVACGEGEVLIPHLVRAAREGGTRGDVLARLAAQPGFYVPSFYDVEYRPDGTLARHVPKPGTGAAARVQKAAIRTTAATDPPATTVFTPDTEFGSRFLVEVVRGCANLCRFCWAGYNYLPTRAFPAEAILRLARAARPHAGRAGLVSIALCDHPEIDRLAREMLDMGYTLSPASLRLDDLAPSFVRLLVESGERTITIAPETGSDRLRRVVNKAMTNEEIVERADLIFASGIENVKLYFMIGLPSEVDDDLVAIRDLTLQVRDRMLARARVRGRAGRIIGSVNPLVPKPGTAYQWLPMDAPAAIGRKIRRLRSLVAGLDHVHFTIKSENASIYQALLSLGDRRVAPAIERASANGADWKAAVRESEIDLDFYVFRDRSADAALPWEVIDAGPGTAFLRAELDKSLRAEWTRPAEAAAQPAPSAALAERGCAPRE